MSDPLKPNKNALVPPYEYLTEGCDPAICDRLNAAAQKQYAAEKARRKEETDGEQTQT